jgi:predicted transcriptional regulator
VDVPEVVKEIPVQQEIVQLDTMQTDSIEKFDRTTFFTRAPQFILTELPKEVKADSSDTLFFERRTDGPEFADFTDSTNFNVNPGPANDRVDWELYRRRGQTPTLPLGQAAVEGAQYLSDLFNKKKKNRPVRLDFVPSKTELAVLQRIWQTSSATDTDIYAAMDSSIKITATDMTVVLEKLEEKGVLEREIVSPQHLFSFPLGQVEMSMKNRRNRVYLYTSKINADEVLHYLQATLYEIEYGKSSVPDSIRTKQADSLREKIMQLIEAKG